MVDHSWTNPEPPADLTRLWQVEHRFDLDREKQSYEVEIPCMSKHAKPEGFIVSATPAGREVGVCLFRDRGRGPDLCRFRVTVVCVRSLVPEARLTPLPATAGRLVGRAVTKDGIAWYVYQHAEAHEPSQAPAPQAPCSTPRRVEVPSRAAFPSLAQAGESRPSSPQHAGPELAPAGGAGATRTSATTQPSEKW